MSNPFAPTLFVGLGGSGAAVLGWLRKMIHDEDANAPVAFRAIDFDESNSTDSGSDPHLGFEEFQSFSPGPIANCVRAIHNRVLIGSNEGWKPAFEPILDWYPDVEGRSIRFAQVEAAGARQWRPLGRVGFVYYQDQIMESIHLGMTDLAERSKNIRETRSKTVVYVVSSIAGGTGAGMLLDVSASIRHQHPDVAVRAILLLPEFFKQVDIGGKLLANAYATLWELAFVKNQHVILPTRDLRGTSSDPRRNVPPLQRIYVVGPYVGDRQPFSKMSHAYAHVADMLKVLTSETLRRQRVSQQANVDADGGATLDDPASRDLFCSFSGASIRLLTYHDLSRLVARRLAREAAGKEPHELFDLLAPPLEAKRIDAIIGRIDELASAEESQQALSDGAIDTLIDDFIEKARPPRWTVESLEKFVTELRDFCGDGPSGDRLTEAAHSVGLLEPACAKFREQLLGQLDQLRTLQDLNPRATLEAVTTILGHARRELELRRVPPMKDLEDFHTWLDVPWKWMLATPILRWPRLHRLRDHAVASVRRHLQTERGPLFEQAIRNTAVAELAAFRDKIRSILSGAEQFSKDVDREISDDKLLNTRNRDRVAISTADADVVRCIKAELERIDDPVLEKELRTGILDAFRKTFASRGHNKNSAADLARAVEDVLSRTQGTRGTFDCVSPLESYGEELLISVIEKCTTPTFELGRTEALMRRRSVRASIPLSFPEHEDFDLWLQRVCVSTLRATYQSSSVTKDERILILVEDLFHPAEEIAGIYDYYADYARRRRPELFHSDRRYPSILPPLLSAAGARGVLRCGNEGCKRDISAVPREAIVCPECRRPIRNRCGNPGCSADDLGSRSNRKELIESGRCPECRQPLKTHWWTCSYHRRRVSTDKPHCPQCVREGRSPEKRPTGVEDFACPSCQTAGVSRPFRAEGDVARACHLGVNGQESADITRRLAETLPGGTDCPICGSRIIPLCPLGNSRYPHYLHRPDDKSPWHCYAHPSERFLTCFVCGLGLHAGARHCDRCGTALEECFYCTPFRNLLISAGADGSPCPACALRRDGWSGTSRDPLRHGHFCANVYACPAGQSIETTRYPEGTPACPFCNETLRPSYTLAHHVSACSVCRTAFPTVARSRLAYRTDDDLCVLCGMAFAETASLPEVERLTAARTLRILLENSRDEDAAHALLDGSAPSTGGGLGDALRRFALRIQQRRRQQAVAKRVDRVLTMFKDWGVAMASVPQASNPAAPVPEPSIDGSVVSIDDILLPARILGLGDERTVVAWVDTLFDRKVSRERFEAALGGAFSAAQDDITRKRLEHVRERARARFTERETE